MCFLNVSQPWLHVGITWDALLKDLFIYLFLARGREGEREGEKHDM